MPLLPRFIKNLSILEMPENSRQSLFNTLGSLSLYYESKLKSIIYNNCSASMSADIQPKMLTRTYGKLRISSNKGSLEYRGYDKDSLVHKVSTESGQEISFSSERGEELAGRIGAGTKEIILSNDDECAIVLTDDDYEHTQLYYY